MSAIVTPINVRGTATLSDIVLRASTNVPPRHRPNPPKAEAQTLPEQPNPNRATSAPE